MLPGSDSSPAAQRQESAIVNVSSVNALARLWAASPTRPRKQESALTINLAASQAVDGIRVNIVAPHDQDPKLGASRRRSRSPPPPLSTRRVEAEDVAAAVAFLLPAMPPPITGHTLPVDGGLMTGAQRLVAEVEAAQLTQTLVEAHQGRLLVKFRSGCAGRTNGSRKLLDQETGDWRVSRQSPWQGRSAVAQAA
jgi:hypothetical protein